MRRLLAITAVALAVTAAGVTGAEAARLRLGGGVHYLRTLGDVKDTGVGNVSIDKNSASLLGSVQSGGGLLRLEGTVEYVFNYLGTDEAMWQPSVWILTPGRIYGGGGMGVGYVDGDWQKDPFYALRAGLDLPLTLSLHLDTYAAYRFQKADDVKGITVDDLNTLTFAAVLRFRLGEE